MLCSYKHRRGDNSKVATHRHESPLTQFTDTRAGPPRPPATWPRCTTPWPAWPASASGTWPRRPTMKRYFLFSWWLFQVFSNNSYQKQISFDVNRIFARCNYKLERLEIQKFSFEIFSGVYSIVYLVCWFSRANLSVERMKCGVYLILVADGLNCIFCIVSVNINTLGFCFLCLIVNVHDTKKNISKELFISSHLRCWSLPQHSTHHTAVRRIETKGKFVWNLWV